MKLSILIRTIVGREDKFNMLLHTLNCQTYIEGEVEFLIEKDNKELSTGLKAQKLIERAKGEYVVFIDDDDIVNTEYIPKILEAIKSKPDCVGILVECHNLPGRTAAVSNRYDKWESNKDGFDYVRTIHHLCPIKREIALQIGYKDIRCGEDADYSLRLKQSGLLKTEVFINEVMYHYLYVPAPSNLKYNM